jgi:hypothetical protein
MPALYKIKIKRFQDAPAFVNELRVARESASSSNALVLVRRPVTQRNRSAFENIGNRPIHVAASILPIRPVLSEVEDSALK